VIAKFGVPPATIPDYLALVGDSADGYPGLPGWGSKSASAVLAHYRSIDAIPLRASEWEVPVRNAPRLAAALAQQHADALLYRHLAVLRTDSPISERLEDLEWQGAPRTEFIGLCDELGLNRVRDSVHRWRDSSA
jgi:5'-3' exonuclease